MGLLDEYLKLDAVRSIFLNGVKVQSKGALNFVGAYWGVAWNGITERVDLTLSGVPSTALALTANTFPARASTGAAANKPISDFGLSLVNAADATAAKTLLAVTGGGDVVGPASAVNLRIAVFSGTTGKLVADGGQTVAGLTALIPAAGGAPADVTKAAAAAGAAATWSKSDHKHDVSTAAPGAFSVAGVAAAEGTATSLARSDHAHSITGRLPFANFVAATAADKVVGSDAAGSFRELSIGNGIERSGTALQVAATLPARGSENVAVDLLPSTQAQGTLATAANQTWDVAIAAGKRYNITADVWVDDGAGGALLFTKALYVVAHQMGGAAVKGPESTIHDNAGAGFSFTSAASTTNIRFTLANTSGSTRSWNIAISVISLDKP